MNIMNTAPATANTANTANTATANTATANTANTANTATANTATANTATATATATANTADTALVTVQSFCQAHQAAGMAYSTLLALVLQAPEREPIDAIKRFNGDVNAYFGVTKVRDARVHIKGYATASNDVSSVRAMIKALGIKGIQYAYDNNFGRNEADAWRKEQITPKTAPTSANDTAMPPAPTYDAEVWRQQEDALVASKLEVSRLREAITQASEALKLRHYKEAARILMTA